MAYMEEKKNIEYTKIGDYYYPILKVKQKRKAKKSQIVKLRKEHLAKYAAALLTGKET